MRQRSGLKPNIYRTKVRAGRGLGDALTGLEHLEGRRMLSSSSFTAQEVYFAELVNRARSDQGKLLLLSRASLTE